jgi:hypothetical protein
VKFYTPRVRWIDSQSGFGHPLLVLNLFYESAVEKVIALN